MTEARDLQMRHMGVAKINACKKCYLPRKTEKEFERIDDRLVSIDNYINRSQEVGKWLYLLRKVCNVIKIDWRFWKDFGKIGE